MNNHMQLYLSDGTKTINLNSPEESIYILPDLEGLTDLPSIRTTSGVNVGMDGGWTSAQNFDARIITIKGVIANQDVSVVEEKRRQLNSLLAKRNLRMDFVTETGRSYSLDVIVTSVNMPMGRLLISQSFQIILRANDPLIYDNTSDGEIVAKLNIVRPRSGFEINFGIPFEIEGGGTIANIRNNGNSPVYLKVRIVGSVHSPRIINETTNEILYINRDASTEEVIEIDTYLQTATVNGQSIYADIDGDWLTLAPGDNIIYMVTDNDTVDDGHATISYKSGYYSI